jgi:hypothetical protein
MNYMSFFSKKKAPAHYRLIVDIEPHSIGLGLTLGSASKLEFIDRQYVAYEKRPTMKQMQSKLTALLKEMLRTSIAPYLNGAGIGSILCIHSAAWSIAETHTVDLQFPKAVKVQEKLILESVRNHRLEGVVNAEQNNLELVYHHMQKVRLNGYPTEHPWDKLAQNVSCDLVEGYVDTSMKKLAENLLLQYEAKLTHVPEGFVAINAAKEVIPEVGKVLVVHVEGETTEIILADDKALAFSHVSLAVKGTRIPTKKEQAAINDAIDAWRNNFIKGAHAVCGDNMPEKIFFFSATHDMHIVEHMLTSNKITAWSNKKHEIINLFGKKSFQHDFMIAAGALYVVE